MNSWPFLLWKVVNFSFSIHLNYLFIYFLFEFFLKKQCIYKANHTHKIRVSFVCQNDKMTNLNQKLNEDHKTLYILTNQMNHDKQNYIKSTILERTWCGSTFERIHKKKLRDYLLKTNAQKGIHKREKTMDQFSQCSIIWISLTQTPQTHENRSNPEVTIAMFIFLDSSHPIPNPTKTYKNPKTPKKPPNQKDLTTWYPQLPTPKNTINTQHHWHHHEIQDITYIIHPFHSSPPIIFYYAFITSKIWNKSKFVKTYKTPIIKQIKPCLLPLVFPS